MRTRLHDDPTGRFLHDIVLETCRKFPGNEAVVDTSCARRISYGEYGELVEAAAKGLTSSGIRMGEVVGIYLPNSWEYAVAYHAITLAGAIPTLLNPSYREREVRYQLEDSGATMLITDGSLIHGMNLAGLSRLRSIVTTRVFESGTTPFVSLFSPHLAVLPKPGASSAETLAALPYSSGTTGMPKGVMLSHFNLVANVFQFLAPGEEASPRADERILCFLPLYHIYGMNVVLNPTLMTGATIVLMPRFDVDRACDLITRERITNLPQVPPVMNAFCAAAEAGIFPARHSIRTSKSGAAPLAPELAKRFTERTGIRVRQGYGMTEASPVTHLGFIEEHLYRPDSIGRHVAQTECRVVDEQGNEVASRCAGELVMRGPQFMLGYWNAPEATNAVLRDGWYWSGDVAACDEDGFYKIIDRRKEMIKFKGFAIAPAEVESVLLEHGAVRDCGVIGKPDDAAGEVPIAFVVLRDDHKATSLMTQELCDYVGERLTAYKQPREVRFVDAIPRNPSGKILRKDLRAQL
jgi:acyl-CoA synthetase (AMP-forming)/AMP-acid ligase II